MLELYQNTENDKDELNISKAKEILQDENMSDEELNKIINAVEIFCKVAYELYSESEQVKDISEEQNEYKQAA